jgi:hypothetical protein
MAILSSAFSLGFVNAREICHAAAVSLMAAESHKKKLTRKLAAEGSFLLFPIEAFHKAAVFNFFQD